MRRVVTAKWCLAHLVLVAAVLVMLRLGQWQWDRANSATGGIQNYAYALQWPLFAVFAIVVYVKTVREELRRDPSVPRTDSGVARGPLDPAASGVRVDRGVRIGVSAPTVQVDDDDVEMQEYNARLAALNAASERVEARRR